MGYRSSRYGRGSGDPAFFFIFGIIIFICVCNWIYHYFRKKKIREYCERNRMTYEESPLSLTGYSEAFDVFNQGDSTYFTAGMYGKRGGIEINLVDFTVVKVYHTSKGRRTSKKHYTLCQLYKEETHFPCFFVRDESFLLDSLGSMFGGQDIDFFEDKTFSDRFVLQGIVESEVRRFFKSKVRKAFLKYHKKGYCYESKGRCLLVYQNGRATLNGRLALLNTALRIFNDISNTGFTNSMDDDIPRNPKYYG